MSKTVFISYAQTAADHKQRVAGLAASLQEAGLRVLFDQDVTSPQGPPEGWPKWMLDQIEQADWVLVVCNEAYYRRFRGKEAPSQGLGARYEGAVIGQTLYSDGMLNHKFVPVLLGDEPTAHIPEPLRGASYYRLPADLAKLTAGLAGERPVVPRRTTSSQPAGWRRITPFAILGCVLGALILIGLMLLPRPAGNFPLTVYVHGESGRQDLILRNQGSVLLQLGGHPRSERIGDKGQAIFTEIPASFRDQPVTVLLDADGFEPIEPGRQYPLHDNSLYMAVRKKPGHLTGSVVDELGIPLPSVRLALNVSVPPTASDATGRFEFTIPGDRLRDDLTLRAVAPGYQVWENSVVVGSPVEIILVPKP